MSDHVWIPEFNGVQYPSATMIKWTARSNPVTLEHALAIAQGRLTRLREMASTTKSSDPVAYRVRNYETDQIIFVGVA